MQRRDATLHFRSLACLYIVRLHCKKLHWKLPEEMYQFKLLEGQFMSMHHLGRVCC